MPKLKTSSSISKRFKITRRKKMVRHKAHRSHLLEKKSPKRKHNLSKTVTVNSCDKKRLMLKINN
uniref:Large ribosomal subunit protein bL35c n=1 Tax=Palmaria palmata TaxID=2822 RepID=A0A455TP61_PALPL|nr:50S ribosomal protein L35 [Palmaria palmata]